MIKFTTIDTVLSKIYRELRGSQDLNETDIIEWIGEALQFLAVYESKEEAVAFLEVNNFETELPLHFIAVIQVAKNNEWVKPTRIDMCPTTVVTPENVVETLPEDYCPVITDCQGNLVGDYNIAYYRPYFDLKWEYQGFIQSPLYIEKFTPVRLSNHTFFNSVVCKESDPELYNSCQDEYTFIGNPISKLRFSFKEGQVALSYLKASIDEETGLPNVPDNISYITAITYYVKWKLMERLSWGTQRTVTQNDLQYHRQEWLRYARQAKNSLKMPTTLDQYQNMLEESHYLIPRHRKYFGFFGHLGREERRPFVDPNYRNNRYIL